MMKRLIIFFFAVTLTGSVFAGEGEYAVSKIPAHLLKNANAVVRVDEQRFEIIHSGRAVERNKYVITILNEKADGLAVFSESYSRHRKINNIEGYLYDSEGKQIGKMKTRDAQDLTGDDGGLIDDSRYKLFSFTHRVYPYTVEYTVELELNSTLFFPAWHAQGGEMISVERSSMEVTSPIDYEYRYKAFNYPGEPVREKGSKTRTDTWKVENLPAYVLEPYGPLSHEFATKVIFGPSEFRIEDYRGNMSTWKEFGNFFNLLKEGRDVLPAEIQKKVHDLVDGIPDPLTRITTLYNYLQKNTRYISIQLGIGGWQPLDAKFVATKAYGDCKALTNYMYALLKEAGIKSYYTMVKSGRNQTYLTVDFPSQQFNHVILCVPVQKDTIWLECTSQTTPAGYLGDFTSNRPALLINEEGGHIVMTKTYRAEDNLQKRKIMAVLNEDGSLTARSQTFFSGIQLHSVHGLINNLSKEKIKEYLQYELELPTYEITAFQYNEKKGFDPLIAEELDIQVTSYASLTGKRLFIVPNVMNRSGSKPTISSNRKYEIVLHNAYLDVDSVTIEIPKGYEPESVPSEVKLDTPFGEYTSITKVEGSRITYYRKLLYRGGRFPAASYGELVKFFEQIYKSDRARLVLVRNT